MKALLRRGILFGTMCCGGGVLLFAFCPGPVPDGVVEGNDKEEEYCKEKQIPSLRYGMTSSEGSGEGGSRDASKKNRGSRSYRDSVILLGAITLRQARQP